MQAVDALESFGEDGKVLAGGQSLGPLLNLRLSTPEVIVDLHRVEELATPPVCGSSVLTVPAMTRQRSIEVSPLVADRVPLLAAALPFVAHRTIRNRGTIGGSLAHADPAAELPAVAVATGASIVTEGRQGRRRIPAESFFLGFFTTALEPDELIVAVDFPVAAEDEGACWVEFAPRRGDFAIVGVAATVRLAADRSIASSRITCSGIADRPWRDQRSEESLVGERPSRELFDAVAVDAAARCRPLSDASGSAEYRRSLVRHLTIEALEGACRHAGDAW